MPSLHGPFPIYRCHTRGCRCNRHRGRANRPQLRAPGGGAALMLADSVERRAAPGLGGTAAKAAVVSAARLKGLAVPLGLVAVWEIVARTGLVPAYLLPGPSEVFTEMALLVEGGELWEHIAVTVRSEEHT